jgi:hypothetical protein
MCREFVRCSSSVRCASSSRGSRSTENPTDVEGPRVTIAIAGLLPWRHTFAVCRNSLSLEDGSSRHRPLKPWQKY